MMQIGVFLSVTVGLLASFQLLFSHLQATEAKIRKRLDEEFEHNDDHEPKSALYKDTKDLNLISGAEEYTYLAGHHLAVPKPPSATFSKRLDCLLQQSGLELKPRQLMYFCSACGLGLAGLGLYFTGVIGGFIAGAAGASMPVAFVASKRKSRQEKFLKQLPSAFELMARVLRGGNSIPQALQAVGDAFEEPLAGAFASCQHQQNFGLRPEAAFREMADRSGVLELRIFVITMMIQRQTGGNLSEVLDRLASLVRTRLRLRQQILTLTAEGRLQGWTLVVLPIVMFVVMYFINRPFVMILLDHSKLLYATVGLMTLGMLWIRRIVTFES